MVFGDIYNIAERVKEYDPSYELYWNPHVMKYQVLAHKKGLRKEGVYDGHPLFSLYDYDEIVFTWDGTPDMRIIHRLHETDVWNYPGGPMKYYDDLMARNERQQQKHEEYMNEEISYVASEHHAHIFDTKKTIAMGV